MKVVNCIFFIFALLECISYGHPFLDFGKILPPGSDSLTSPLKILSKNPMSTSRKRSRPRNRSWSRYGKGEENEMSGFLGIGSLVDPLIILKKLPADSPVPEAECVRTRFMYPFRDPVFFVGNASIRTRRTPMCSWNIIGTEVCAPILSCPIFQLDNTNNTCEEFLEVYDGSRGYSKYCGGDVAPLNVTAADGLRDLYIKFKTTKWEGPENANLSNILKFNCTLGCRKGDDAQALPAVKEPKMNPYCHCGKKLNQDKIINGEDAAKGEFPWLASLVETNTRQPFCGGALINDRFVLTAAHCIKGIFMNFKNIQIVLNGQVMDPLPNSFVHIEKIFPKSYDAKTLLSLDSGNNSIRISVEEIIIHPLYVTETNDFDVALLRLPTSVNFGDDAHRLIPTCLPKLGSYLRTYSKVNATIAGWGLTEAEGEWTSTVLKKLVVTVIPPIRCKILYAHRINRRMMCAGYEAGGRDSCMGDSGGPLVYEERPQVWYQIGTVSWGEGCASKANPGVYIRTTESGQWISYHSNYNEATWCSLPP